ncbi:hypothetical protein GEMRC1_009452 [Eukaryota sp. GEM-RC1]
MLSLWVVDVYLRRMSEVTDTDLEDLSFEFKEFLKENKDILHKKTTFRLISSHGRVDELVYFANLVEDYKQVVDLLLQEGRYEEALDTITATRKIEYLYKYSAILMREIPSLVIKTWYSLPNLDPTKLIPSLLLISSDESTTLLTSAVLYLETQIRDDFGKIVPAIVNLLLSFYAELDDNQRLIAFLSDSDISSAVDLQYALRICSSRSKLEASVRVYSVLGLYEEAVTLALQSNDVTLAQENANMGGANDPELKKKLWLKIAKTVIASNHGNVSKIIDFLKASECLRIEDILPYLDTLTNIGALKDELLTSLKEYAIEIEDLNISMDKSTKSADLTRKSLKELKNRSIEVSAADTCLFCNVAALHRPFYVFPCAHKYHEDCLLKVLSSKLTPLTLSTLRNIGEEMSNLTSTITDLECTQLPSEDVLTSIQKLRDQKLALSSKYDALLAAECPCCGDVAISAIDEKFHVDHDKWTIDVERGFRRL